MSLIATAVSSPSVQGPALTCLFGAVGVGGAESNTTVSFPITLLENDLVVVVAYTTANIASGGLVVESDAVTYTSGSSFVQVGSGANSLSGEVFYTIMGSTPDTSVRVAGISGATPDSTGLLVYAFRNADTSTPLDTTSTNATGSTAATISAAAITPVTYGALVLQTISAEGALTGVFTPTISAGAEISLGLGHSATATRSDTDDISVGGTVVYQRQPAAAPALSFGYEGGAGEQYIALSAAIRPAFPGA